MYKRQLLLVANYRLLSLFQIDFLHYLGTSCWTLIFWNKGALHHSKTSCGRFTSSPPAALDSSSPLHFDSSVLLPKGQATSSPYLQFSPVAVAQGARLCCLVCEVFFLLKSSGKTQPTKGWPTKILITSLFTNANFKKLLYKFNN